MMGVFKIRRYSPDFSEKIYVVCLWKRFSFIHVLNQITYKVFAYTLVQIYLFFCIYSNNLFINPYLICIFVKFWFFAKHVHVFVKQKYFLLVFSIPPSRRKSLRSLKCGKEAKKFVLGFHSVFFLFLPCSRAVCAACLYYGTKALARNRGKRFWKNRFTFHCVQCTIVRWRLV